MIILLLVVALDNYDVKVTSTINNNYANVLQL